MSGCARKLPSHPGVGLRKTAATIAGTRLSGDSDSGELRFTLGEREAQELACNCVSSFTMLVL